MTASRISPDGIRSRRSGDTIPAARLPDGWIAEALALATPRTIVACLARRIAADRGLTPPAAFADVANGSPALIAQIQLLSPEALTLDILGAAWEELLAPQDKRAQGAHFTPSLGR